MSQLLGTCYLREIGSLKRHGGWCDESGVRKDLFNRLYANRTLREKAFCDFMLWIGTISAKSQEIVEAMRKESADA